MFADSAVAAPFVRYKRDAYERPGESPVGFRLDLAAKDLRLALAHGRGVGADLPQTRANLAVLDDAVAAGYGTDDESAVAQHLRAVTHPGGSHRLEAVAGAGSSVGGTSRVADGDSAGERGQP